jgi:hypothetical protein
MANALPPPMITFDRFDTTNLGEATRYLAGSSIINVQYRSVVVSFLPGGSRSKGTSPSSNGMLALMDCGDVSSTSLTVFTKNKAG